MICSVPDSRKQRRKNDQFFVEAAEENLQISFVHDVAHISLVQSDVVGPSFDSALILQCNYKIN